MSYMPAKDPGIHFGLGQRKTVEPLEITWPGGHVEQLSRLLINQILNVKEGSGIVPIKFRRISWK